MGFFSKLKRLWTTEDSPEQQTPEGVVEESTDSEQVAAEEAQEDSQAETVELEEQVEDSETVEVVSEPEEEPAGEQVEITLTPEFILTEEPEAEAEVLIEPEIEELPVIEPEIAVEQEAIVEPSVEVEEVVEPEVAEIEVPAEPVSVAEPEVVVEPEPTPEPEVIEPEVISEPVVESVPEPAPVAAMEPATPETATVVADDQPQWQKDLTVALRGAEPKLSVWLEHVLDGIEEVGDPLWERLRFFFDALDAPKNEAEEFITKFADWLDDMEYDYVSDFRSELQYRLALALDLEDEEDERSRLFLKLSEGLSKTKEQITKQIDGLLATHSEIDESFWEEFEEILIMSDVGFEPTMKLVERLRERVRKAGTKDPAKFKEFMREELEEIFKTGPRITAVNMPEVVLMVGVNGVGKTTTIAKLAYRAQLQGKKVLIAAGDTFRAAAIEQLQVWADRIGVDFHAKSANSDPAAVAYEAVEKAVEGGYDLLFVDTAGRLQTKVGLMDELQKIRNVLGKKHEGAPHRTILTIDATTGQNALSQTKLFNEVAHLDEIILTKLDGTAKGGIVVAIAMEFNLPITYIGLGEKMEDLRPFNGADFATALLGLEDTPEA
ncbi:signal recognition particle-docking protein FtsY [Halodesulfovibrio sp.]|jgi:fused signal recognition particle receptor|uniref:signal recognition particle-docking protein FtsY n=1 Tax=Halodesulfovibrio sp. TaxID=1912772 RepID=UPI0025F56FD7|nr:signal recognition particle-docking protein FtsY [Halodesulfovibrio sp.]MCT4626995.1 signal recognition particle-docking protein FtsY [Halodesulfovibrio sp.]